MERKTVLVGKLFVLFKLVASTSAFAWKIRSSPATGAVPPQLPAVVQLLFAPAPFQKRFAACEPLGKPISEASNKTKALEVFSFFMINCLVFAARNRLVEIKSFKRWKGTRGGLLPSR